MTCPPNGQSAALRTNIARPPADRYKQRDDRISARARRPGTAVSGASTTASRSACTAAARWPGISTATLTSSSPSPPPALTGTWRSSASPTPFDSYDQALVPELDAGARESAGCDLMGGGPPGPAARGVQSGERG